MVMVDAGETFTERAQTSLGKIAQLRDHLYRLGAASTAKFLQPGRFRVQRRFSVTVRAVILDSNLWPVLVVVWIVTRSGASATSSKFHTRALGGSPPATPSPPHSLGSLIGLSTSRGVGCPSTSLHAFSTMASRRETRIDVRGAQN